MARTIAIRKKTLIAAVREFEGTIALGGALSVNSGPSGPPGTVFSRSVGSLTPSGELTTESSGPSLVTVPLALGGSLGLGGSVAPVNQGGGTNLSTEAVSGTITPTGGFTGVIDPASVTQEKKVVGVLNFSGQVTQQVLNVIVPQLVLGQITPHGAVATLASGPSIETKPKSVSGGITPAGALSSSVTTPGIPVTASMSGSVTPAGALTTGIDPTTVTLLQSVSGAITPAGVVTLFSSGTIGKSVGGTITPHATLAVLPGGPSYVTISRSMGGSLTPHGATATLAIASPIISADVAGTITPSGAVSSGVSGPSIETKTKNFSSNLPMTGGLTSQVSGPSLITVPKSVSGTIIPSGAVARQTGGPSYVTVTKSIAGTITPHSFLGLATIPGTPIGANPLYVGMAGVDQSELDNVPTFPSLSFTQVPATVNSTQSLLNALRTRGMKCGIGMTSANMIGDPAPTPQYPPNTFLFNMTKYQGVVDRVAAVPGIASFIADGTLSYLMCGDELHHQKWNGTIPPSVRKQMVQYAKQQLPGVKTALRMTYQNLTGASLPSGGWQGSLDYGWASYTGPLRSNSTGMTAIEFYTAQRDGLAAGGIPGLITGGNWWNGGDGSSGISGPQTDLSEGGAGQFWVMSTAEIRAAVDAAIQMPESNFFGWWNDPNGSNLGGASDMLILYQRQDYIDAFEYGRDAGLLRGSSGPPKNYFTNTGYFAAPYPPAAIPVGQAVRDPLTNHKVFHLLDNGRLQDADYPALNSNNSIIYFIRGGAGQLGDLTWNVGSSQVQVGNVRAAFGAGPFGLIDGVIWARDDSRYMYFVSAVAPAQLYRRDVNAGTTNVLKAFSSDSSFSAFWGAEATTVRVAGLHCSRGQEEFAAVVLSNNVGAGAVFWSRLTSALWNWRVPSGKRAVRVTMDDSGVYAKVHFDDQTWVILTLGTQGAVTQSAVLSHNNPPVRDDGQVNLMWHANGGGITSRPYSPATALPTMVYDHPERSSKQDGYSVGRVSVQSTDELIYESLFYTDAIATAWVQHSGEVYRINWSAEMTAMPQKLDPEVVRQGIVQLLRRTS